jgi:methionine-rich copper-binding protein CopC
MRIRFGLGLTLIALASIAPAAPAYAHAELMSTSPAAGQAVAPPAAVTLRFDDVVQLPPRALRVTGPRGNAVPVHKAQPNSKTLQGSLPRHLRGGHYVVRWRVVADDGHTVSGSFRFVVRAAAKHERSGAALPRPSSHGGGTATVLLTLFLSLVTIVALGVALVRLRREKVAQ